MAKVFLALIVAGFILLIAAFVFAGLAGGRLRISAIEGCIPWPTPLCCPTPKLVAERAVGDRLRKHEDKFNARFMPMNLEIAAKLCCERVNQLHS